MHCSLPGSSVLNSPGKNTGVSSHSLLRGIFLTQGLGLQHCRQILYLLSYQRSPLVGGFPPLSLGFVNLSLSLSLRTRGSIIMPKGYVNILFFLSPTNAVIKLTLVASLNELWFWQEQKLIRYHNQKHVPSPLPSQNIEMKTILLTENYAHESLTEPHRNPGMCKVRKRWGWLYAISWNIPKDSQASCYTSFQHYCQIFF